MSECGVEVREVRSERVGAGGDLQRVHAYLRKTKGT